MAIVGRLLEGLGIVVVPLALVVGAKSGSMREELGVLAVGAVLFWIGRALGHRRED